MVILMIIRPQVQRILKPSHLKFNFAFHYCMYVLCIFCQVLYILVGACECFYPIVTVTWPYVMLIIELSTNVWNMSVTSLDWIANWTFSKLEINLINVKHLFNFDTTKHTKILSERIYTIIIFSIELCFKQFQMASYIYQIQSYAVDSKIIWVIFT